MRCSVAPATRANGCQQIRSLAHGGDPDRSCGSERLAEHALVLTTKGKSYRMRKRRSSEPPVETTSTNAPVTITEKKDVKERETKKSRAR